MSLNLQLGNIRRKSIPVKIGNVVVGGQYPIVVQSMTNTDTADINSTYKQTPTKKQPSNHRSYINLDPLPKLYFLIN